MVRTGPRVLAHIQAEHLYPGSHLRRGQPHTSGRHPHRRHQVSGQLHNLRRRRIDHLPDVGKHRSRSAYDVKHTSLHQKVVLGPTADAIIDEYGVDGGRTHRSSLSTTRRLTPTPSSAATPERAVSSAETSTPAGRSTSATRRYSSPANRVVRSVMFPPTRATSATTEETMPGRSPPCTVRTYDDPTDSCADSGGTSRTDTASEPSAVSPDRASSICAAPAEPAGPAQINIIANWPRNRVIVESSRFSPRFARTLVVSAMMPGRSCPMTVIACRVTASSLPRRLPRAHQEEPRVRAPHRASVRSAFR